MIVLVDVSSQTKALEYLNYSYSLYLVTINTQVFSEKPLCKCVLLDLNICILHKTLQILGLFGLLTQNGVSH